MWGFQDKLNYKFISQTLISMYRAETRTIKQKDKIKIQVMDINFLRCITGKIKEIKLGMRQLQKMRGSYGCLKKLQMRRLQWVGHIK
jgi:hypothetical protein